MATKAKSRIAEVNGDGGTPPPDADKKHLTITPPKFEVIQVRIIGTAPYVQNRFGQKAIEQMKSKQEAGSQGKKGTKREAKDFQALYLGAMHKSTDGWYGIPAPAFRNAMVDACRLVGFRMTHAKLGVFCVADGSDVVDGTPLVKITKGEPHYVEHPVRNESGVADIRPRPMWDAGWEAVVTLQFDADMFSAADVVNLLHRVGVQVGVGEGRPCSKNSNGLGWGIFKIATEE